MAFEPKQFGRFYLLEKLAVGGMAEIYKAKTYGAEGFEKLLAIKRILPHCSADKDFIRMLIDEAKLSVLLSHANVVQVYDLGKVGEDFFISMEYINGVNLRDILYRCREQNRPCPPELAIFIASEICKGLDYAHRKRDSKQKPLNIVHRDVSPQNILISFEGEVKIVDFGIAKAAMNISHTMAGILKGKIAYMSPEQALGKTVDYRTDLFSTGIILYECLTGTKLFSGESQFEVLKKIRTTRVSAAKLPEEIPAPLRNLLGKALAYTTKERYQTAGDMQSELTKALYSTYVDFTPQRLAAFVRELFHDELARQQNEALARHQREQQTSSMNLDAGAAQEDIVHRQPGLTSAPSIPPEDDTTAGGGIPQPPESSLASLRSTPPPRVARILAVIGITLALTFGTVAYLRWVTPWPFTPRPASEQTFGTLRVESQPSGATIQLNGKTMEQVTPAMIEQLALGKNYQLTLSKTGYSDVSQEIALNSTTPVKVELSLPASFGTIQIVSIPTGAAISIDGQETHQVTPATIDHLPLGKPLTLLLRKDHYIPYEQQLTLEQPTPREIIASLAPQPTETIPTEPGSLPGPDIPVIREPGEIAPTGTEKTTPTTPKTTPKTTPTKNTPKERVQTKPKTKTPATKIEKKPVEKMTKKLPTEKSPAGGKGTITIRSKPRGATVYIDGRSFGRTPITIRGIAAGVAHSVRVVLKGYAPWSSSVNVAQGKERIVDAPLQKTP